MNIRLATKEDVDQLVTLFKHYREFYKVSNQDITEIHTFINERIEKSDSKIFIATSQNQLIGFVQLYPSFSTVSLKRQWVLNDFYIEPPARRQGYGTALMHAVIDYFKKDSKGFILVTEKTNTIAKSFYEKSNLQTGIYDFYTYYY